MIYSQVHDSASATIMAPVLSGSLPFRTAARPGIYWSNRFRKSTPSLTRNALQGSRLIHQATECAVAQTSEEKWQI